MIYYVLFPNSFTLNAAQKLNDTINTVNVFLSEPKINSILYAQLHSNDRKMNANKEKKGLF